MTEDRKIDVLDHGFARLVDHMGDDLSVVRAARVSYDAAWRAGQHGGSDAKLINYLWKNKHSTPFEAVEFQFEIKAPIFVLRQWHRHRTWSYNEVSARYTTLPDEYYTPSADNIGTQSPLNKQARDTRNDLLAAIRSGDLVIYRSTCEEALKRYRALLVRGWPRELARCVLPLSIYSHMFAKVNLWNLFHFLTLRMGAHSQWEIQQYAKALLALIEPVIPVCVSAWKSEANETQSG